MPLDNKEFDVLDMTRIMPNFYGIRNHLTVPEVKYLRHLKGTTFFWGNFQSSKTKTIMELASLYRYEFNKTVIIAVRAFNDDLEQIKLRIKDYQKVLHINNFSDIYPKDLRDMSDYDELLNEMNQGRGVFITLSNVQTLKKISDLVLKNPDIKDKFILIEDEGDLFLDVYTMKQKDYTSAEKELKKIREFSFTTFVISASPLTPLSHPGLSRVIKLTPVPPGLNFKYYGIDSVSHIETLTVKKGSTYKWKDDNSALDMVFTGFMNSSAKDIPNSILINPGTKKEEHSQIYDYIVQAGLNDRITTIIHNDDGTEVMRPSSHPLYKTDPIIKYNTGKNSTKTKAKYSLSQVYQDIKNDENYNHRYICTVSGNKAGRGISFVSSDYKWHLTHLYLVRPKSSHTEGMAQAIARIFGMYDDNPELVLFLDKKSYNDVMKDIKFGEWLVDMFINTNAKNLSDFVVDKEFLEKVQIEHGESYVKVINDTVILSNTGNDSRRKQRPVRKNKGLENTVEPYNADRTFITCNDCPEFFDKISEITENYIDYHKERIGVKINKNGTMIDNWIIIDDNKLYVNFNAIRRYVEDLKKVEILSPGDIWKDKPLDVYELDNNFYRVNVINSRSHRGQAYLSSNLPKISVNLSIDTKTRKGVIITFPTKDETSFINGTKIIVE